MVLRLSSPNASQIITTIVPTILGAVCGGIIRVWQVRTKAAEHRRVSTVSSTIRSMDIPLPVNLTTGISLLIVVMPSKHTVVIHGIGGEAIQTRPTSRSSSRSFKEPRRQRSSMLLLRRSRFQNVAIWDALLLSGLPIRGFLVVINLAEIPDMPLRLT